MLHFFISTKRELPSEIFFRIIITNILNHFSSPHHIIGQFTLFDFFSKNITKNSPEIFMPWVTHETATIRKHPYKPSQQAHIA